MLILNRKKNQSIMIGDDIEVKVMPRTHGSNNVYIGIDAPKDVKVYREEIYKRIQSEGKSDEK